MGWSLSSLIPKNTIVGKALRGDVSGAVSSAKNYVNSGELMQDIKNVGAVATNPTSVDAWKNVGSKAVLGYKGNGNLLADATKSVLDKGTNITSLKPTPTQAYKADQAQASANIALAVGSGVPVAKASQMQTPLIGTDAYTGMEQQTPPPPPDGTTNKDHTIYYVIGGGLLAYALLGKKKRAYARRYVRRTYARTRSYARRTYGRAMSYRRRKY